MTSLLRSMLAGVCLLLAACSQQVLVDQWTPHPEAEIARSILEQVRQGDIEPVKARLSDELRQTPDIDAKLQQFATYFPAGTPRSVKVVGVHTLTNASGTRYDLTFEYAFADGWALGHARLARTGDAVLVEGLHVQRLAQPLEQVNAFTLIGKGPLHWIVLLLCIAIPAFCIYAFVLCLRTPIVRRKWLWALFTLLGLITVHFNWTSGEFDFQLLSCQLLGASGLADPYGPMILGMSLPLGAIWFLACRGGLMANAAAARAAASSGQELA
ncbi:hypothetical protein ACXU4B_12365 [Dyella soli]|uniref:DUF3887 domain-containing protein n=1 Tax=Dyella soli TaxID=522319 RepID=A0A4V2NL20_9GAMM|nr:hypothetical protein [Dyella soli]TCI07058.1 hypothetical protein EZM97_31075 [Dyella soli]